MTTIPTTTLMNNARNLRKLACEHDSIDPTASFFVLSDTNPHATAYNEAMTILQARRGEEQRAARARNKHYLFIR
jgi:hypothetical protein